ncbi:hypothetical protein [Kineococcus terrestris]|uniref:hypothetical protein n=1 Tax=Kineococcus terrestris TaxID=2044856 RepID=UPI0034DAD4D4
MSVQVVLVGYALLCVVAGIVSLSLMAVPALDERAQAREKERLADARRCLPEPTRAPAPAAAPRTP